MCINFIFPAFFQRYFEPSQYFSISRRILVFRLTMKYLKHWNFDRCPNHVSFIVTALYVSHTNWTGIFLVFESGA